MAVSERVVISCTHGEEEPDRVLVAYLVAVASLDQGKEVVMFLTGEAVRLALPGYADGLRPDKEPPVSRSTPSSPRKAAASTCARSASKSAISTTLTSWTTQNFKGPRR